LRKGRPEHASQRDRDDAFVDVPQIETSLLLSIS
jgi:hypothetical protein